MLRPLRPRRAAALATVTTLVAAAVALGMGHPGLQMARACGGFFRAKAIAPEKQPSLTREKVLIVHDADKGRQHFIREVAFTRATEPFGFVVPTPTRPQVAAVKKTPFTLLRKTFPFAAPMAIGRGGGGAKGGFGSGARPGVTVLEKKKVGSFTAFVLSATDEKALAGWLSDNDLVSTKEADLWLAHYVRMGFYYVAMRYDPPRRKAKEGSEGTVLAETMRISFDSPLPYYPYLEPEPPAAMAGLGIVSPRLLELWVVGREEMVPVALREQDGERHWVRPLQGGQVTADARKKLEAAFEDEVESLLPSGALVVQTFQDQKNSRKGFADVLFAPKEAQPATAQKVAKLEPLLGILDPQLVPAKVAPVAVEGDQ